MEETRSVSVIFPCYNEEHNVEQAVSETLDTLGDLDLEVIVEEDGSTDRTAELARTIADSDPRVRALSFPGARLGRGGGFLKGAEEASKDVIVLMDADLAIHPRHVRDALERITAGADLVIGSRNAHGGRRIVDQTWARILTGVVYRTLVRLLFFLPYSDFQCGFKVMRRRILDDIDLSHGDWEFDTELIWKVHRTGLRIEEMGIVWTERGDSRLRIFPDAFRMLRGILLMRLGR